MKRIINPIFILPLLFFGFVVYFVLGSYAPIFKFLEDTSLFLYTFDFFVENVTVSSGFLYYLGGFVRQFYYNHELAALIVALLFTLIAVLTQLITKAKGALLSLAYLSPMVLLSFQLSTAFEPELMLGMIFALLFTYGYSKLDGFRYKYVAALVAFVPTFLGFGFYAFLALAMSVAYSLVRDKKNSKWFFMAAAVLLCVIMPYVASNFIFNIYPTELSYVVFKDTIFVDTKTSSMIPFKVAVVTPIVLILISKLTDNWLVFNNYIVTLIGVLFISVCGYKVFGTVTNEVKSLMYMLKVNNEVEDENWDELLKLSLRDKAPTEYATQAYNLALCMKGGMADNLFALPQMYASEGLTSKLDGGSGQFSAKFAPYVGLYNMAYRWAYECMCTYGDGAKYLRVMIDAAVVNGEYVIALKYIDRLKETLRYSDYAVQYEDYILGKSTNSFSDEIDRKRTLKSQNNSLVSETYSISEMIKRHAESNLLNDRAFHYYMADCLLTGNLEDFARVLPLKYGVNDKLPRHYEEAVIFYNFNYPPEVAIKGLNISKDSEKRYFEFVEATMMQSAKIKSFENTFWYYVYTVSSQQ